MKHIILSRTCLNSPAMLKNQILVYLPICKDEVQSKEEHCFVSLVVSNVLQEVENNSKEDIKLFEPHCLLMKRAEVMFEAPTLSEESDKRNTRGANINQGKYAYDELQSFTIHATIE